MGSTVKIALIQREATTNDIGEPVYVETSRNVWASVEAVYMSHKVYAQQLGFKASLRLVTPAFNYNGEELVEVSGVRYLIYHYEPKGDKVILNLEKQGGVNSGAASVSP